MTKRLTAVAALLLAAILLFSGCSSDQLKSVLSIETDSYDPAVEMAADMLNKTVKASNLAADDFEYQLLDDDTAVVTAYKGSSTVINIPDLLDGHTVVGVENKAFYQSDITQLILPDSLIVVGNYAAMYCTKLESVTFGRNIKTIGVSAFESNGNNTNFTGEGSLKEIIFNGTPEVIGQKAFYFNDKLEEIVIPDGIKRIENWAFAKCYGAKKIILGEGLEFIGDHAFLKCRSVQEAFIPGSCKTVDVSAFYQCTGINQLTIENGVEALAKGVFEECSAIESITVPASVKKMAPYVFYNCSALSECIIEGSPQTMEKDIFTGCADNIRIITADGSSAAEYGDANGITVEIRH